MHEIIILFFVLNVLVEYAVFASFFRKNFAELIGFVFLINLATWPLANFLFAEGFNFYLIETGVVIAETFLIFGLMRIGLRKAFLVSLTANFITASLSFLF